MTSHGQNNAETQPSNNEAKSFRDEASSIDVDPSSIPRWYDFKHTTFFSRYLSITTIMLIWPWIFFGVVWGKGGINIHSTDVETHQKDTLYFVTAFSSIIVVVTVHLFSKAVASLARKRVVYKDTAISDVAFFTALRNRAPTLSLLRQGRPYLLFMVFVYLVMFALITPGLTALLTPIHFKQTIDLHGRELDFGSDDPECVDWFNNAPTINNTCTWRTFNGSMYTDCLVENQMVDVLESGRGNVLSSIKNIPNVSITYVQLGSPGGLHFLGSISGLLPIGPKGIPAFNTLDKPSNSPFFDASALYPTYNYTLYLQGISSNVSCAYTGLESPVTFPPIAGSDTYENLGSCPSSGFPDILANTSYLLPTSNYTFGSWTCQTAENSYSLYLRGANGYKTSLGNITCTISSIQPTVFPLEYTGQSDLFTAQSPNSYSSSPVSQLTSNMMKSIGTVIWQAQSVPINSVAESILTLAVKAYNKQLSGQDPIYLLLLEDMIRGMLDYEATYIRLLYSTHVNDSTPQLCLRNITGSADLQKFGWSSSGHNAAYLIPITLVNLTTVIILIVAMRTGTSILPRFDPTDPESLILSHDESGIQLSTVRTQPANLIPWRTLVAFGRNKDGIYRLWPKDEIVPE